MRPIIIIIIRYAMQKKYKNQAGVNFIIIIIVFYTPGSKDPRG